LIGMKRIEFCAIQDSGFGSRLVKLFGFLGGANWVRFYFLFATGWGCLRLPKLFKNILDNSSKAVVGSVKITNSQLLQAVFLLSQGHSSA
ncbi:hypothetical protein, partial [Neisseria musculi]|uniref:hypothetical protein n=1 Tax=Neisseria musculi TaxID=1815583 RepID=UPI00362192D0